MKNLFDNFPIQKSIIAFLIIWNSCFIHAQFQTAIGLQFPTNEVGVSGLMTNSGDFLILANHINHPLGIGNSSGDIMHVQLNSLGYITQPSKMLGQDLIESAIWMEKTVCGNGGYIIMGSQFNGSNSNVIVALTDSNCNPIWTRRIGTAQANNNANGGVVKEDGNGDFIVITTKDVGSDYVIEAVKLDCVGDQIWSGIYPFSRSAIATSITEFATLSSACTGLPNEYFITGIALDNNGDDEMFIMSIDVASGNFNWMNTYDIVPNQAEYATCIQGSCLFNAQLNGELWVSGYSTDLITNKAQVFMMKTDITGNLLWSNTYEIVGDVELATHFQFATTGELMITGRAEGLTSPPRPATRSGQCFLMKLSNDGNQVFWTRVYDQGFASQANRVEPLNNNNFFLTGYSYKSDPLAAFDFDILAIKTDSSGLTSANCLHNQTTNIIKRFATSRGITILAEAPDDFSASILLTKIFQDTQRFCVVNPKPKCDSLFTFISPFQKVQNTCCFDLFVDNPTPKCFTGVQITLSSGSFNNITANSGWIASSISSSQIQFQHSSNFVPVGSINPGNFCLTGTSNPYNLTVTYPYSSNGVTGKCDENYVLNCPALPFQSCNCRNGGIPGADFVNNGNFSNGYTGFTSGYNLQNNNTIALSSGQYSIRNSTNLINSQWKCIDHTAGLPLGNFMVVDGSGNTAAACWRTNVNVITGREYSFCAFANNLVDTTKNHGDPVVGLYINSAVQVTAILPEKPDVWVNLTASWTSTVTGIVSIEIRPVVPSSNAGFDFALDDIAFHECFADTTCANLACPKNLVQNPGFFQGAVIGNINGPGASSNWTAATQTPQVANDSCCDPIAILMWGNLDTGESICQSLNFQQGHKYSIRFCARFFDQTTLPNKYIRFGFSARNGCNSTYNCISPTCENIGESGLITNQGWQDYQLLNWTANANWSHLIIRAFNNVADNGTQTTVSWGMIDDVCIEELTTATEDISANIFSIYPNPTNSNLIIELNQAATSDYTISAIDLCGKNVLKKILVKGEKQAVLDMSQIANGFYLIELRDKNFKAWYQKVVKE